MKSLIISSVLSIVLLSTTFANSIEKDTEFDNERKSFLGTSSKNLGVLPVTIEKDLVKSYSSISISDVANYRSVSPVREVNATQVRYTFLKASSFNAVTGETSVYSEVMEVHQPLAVEENSQVLVKREELLSEFQENIQQKFPDRTFSFGVNNLQGIFDSWEEANRAKEINIQNAQHYSNISRVVLTNN